MTKKERVLWDSYRVATLTDLRQAYKTRPSRAKEMAFSHCIEMMLLQDGFRARIPTHNSHFFTFAYLVPFGHEYTLIYHTSTHTHAVHITGAQFAELAD